MHGLSMFVAQIHPDADDHAKVGVEKVSTEQRREDHQPFVGSGRLGWKRSHGGLRCEDDAEHQERQQVDQHLELRYSDPLDHVHQLEVGFYLDLVGHFSP